MNLESYRRQREALLEAKPKYRDLCTQCLQPGFGCYCAHIQRFDPQAKFVILIHPIEQKRRIATGRMSHLTLENSELIVGQDYSGNRQVSALLENPTYQPVVLYPGPQALNLSRVDEERKSDLFSNGKHPLIFVIDGTWATARKTMHLSQNLKTLPRICFTPPEKSRFRVRKQPGVDCYSTLEAIHHTIELLGARIGFDISTRHHDRLISVFDKMVERQLEFVRDAFDNPKSTSSRRPRKRIA